MVGSFHEGFFGCSRDPVQRLLDEGAIEEAHKHAADAEDDEHQPSVPDGLILPGIGAQNYGDGSEELRKDEEGDD